MEYIDLASNTTFLGNKTGPRRATGRFFFALLTAVIQQ